MANVTLTIGGRGYTVACAPGEEAHIRNLARTIDGKIATMGDMVGQGEARVLLFAALLLADELHETQGSEDVSTLAPVPPGIDPEVGERLSSIADALENIADRLEAEPIDA
ncbi:MAG: cell division protein ZapA [Novosphingobium sp.]